MVGIVPPAPPQSLCVKGLVSGCQWEVVEALGGASGSNVIALVCDPWGDFQNWSVGWAGNLPLLNTRSGGAHTQTCLDARFSIIPTDMLASVQDWNLKRSVFFHSVSICGSSSAKYSAESDHCEKGF